MTPRATTQRDRRAELLAEIGRLAEVAIFGTLSETYRRCGSVGCHCQGRGPKHGPHLHVSYRSAVGKTTGYYVPKAAQEKVRAGVAAWQTLQERLRDLAELTKEHVLQRAKEDREE
jgi:cytochrome c2